MRSVRHALVVLPLLLGQAQLALANPPAVEESDRERARQLFDEATQFGKRGDYPKAKSSLSAAWALVKSWDIAVNLGTAELKLGQYRDAAEHLAWGVREGSTQVGPSNESVVKSRALLAQAAMRVGTVKLGVDRPGATVLADDQFVAKSPLVDPIYFEPGSHSISAHPVDPSRGPVEVRIEIAAGEVQERVLTLRPPANASSAAGGSASPLVATDHTGIKARTIVTIGGGALTAVATGIALMYTVKAAGARSDTDDLKSRLGSRNCDQPNELCNELADAQERRTDANRMATPAWVAAGVLGAATLGTFFLWPKDSTSGAVTNRNLFLQVGPTSMVLRGAF